MTYPLKIDTGKTRAICEYCGKEFEQTREDKRFCCRAHRIATHKARSECKNKPGYHRQYREKLMAQAFSILGNQCQHCGEKDPMVLCVDHIEPVGKSQENDN